MKGKGFAGALRPVVLTMLAAGVLSACTTGQQGRQPDVDDVVRKMGAPSVEAPVQRAALPVTRSPHARNVIILINDGAGWGAWDGAAYWQYGSRAGMPYARFSQRYGMTTFPLNTSTKATKDNVSRIGYDAVKAWDDQPNEKGGLSLEAYRYLSADFTDSAAAGTALASGQKTYNSAINVDNTGKRIGFITEVARRQGRATGVVTSVPFSHATPAAFGANNASRKAHHEIADQMLGSGVLDLIIGTGAPGYNVNGSPCNLLAKDESRKGCDDPHEYLSRQTWEKLASSRLVPKGQTQPWTVVRRKSDFEALARGSRQVDGPFFGSPEVAGNGTLQQGREAKIVGSDPGRPSGVARIDNVPTLSTLTEVALRHLSRDPDGFFLMVEGGATDWAAHTSNCQGSDWNYSDCQEGRPELGRLLEETVEFNDAVESVVNWVERYSNWDETLVIVTTDHDNSMPMGPDADKVPFQPVENRGKGVMPGMSFRASGDHANSLVPLWAHGAGAAAFESHVRGRDPNFARHAKVLGNDGSYIDNTDVFRVMKAALAGESTPGKDDGRAPARGR